MFFGNWISRCVLPDIFRRPERATLLDHPYTRYDRGGKGYPHQEKWEYSAEIQAFSGAGGNRAGFRPAWRAAIGCPARWPVLHLASPGHHRAPCRAVHCCSGAVSVNNHRKSDQPVTPRSKQIVFAVILALAAIGMFAATVIKTGWFS